jgi:hypothetical protein
MAIDGLSKLQKELNHHIVGPLQKLCKINLAKPEKLEDFDKLIRALPTGEILGNALNEWVKKVQDAMRVEQTTRKHEFGRILNDFIRLQKETGMKTREFSNSWRIGLLELELRPEFAQVRCRYNEEVLNKWTPITGLEDLRVFYDAASEKLRKSELPFPVLRDAMWEAYEYVMSKQDATMFNRKSVPAKEVIKELKVVLYRKSLERKAPRLKETADWVFLYNIDLYFSRLREVPSDKRLSLEAGSQMEISKGRGIILNGLDAGQDYRIYCYFKS